MFNNYRSLRIQETMFEESAQEHFVLGEFKRRVGVDEVKWGFQGAQLRHPLWQLEPVAGSLGVQSSFREISLDDVETMAVVVDKRAMDGAPAQRFDAVRPAPCEAICESASFQARHQNAERSFPHTVECRSNPRTRDRFEMNAPRSAGDHADHARGRRISASSR